MIKTAENPEFSNAASAEAGLRPARDALFRLGLAAVAVFALALRLRLPVGVVRPDALRYAELSYHVLRGGSLFDESVFFASSRLTLIGPLLLANKLLGFGELATVSWPLFCSLGIVVVAGLLGKELFDWRVGLLAGFALSVLPIELELATALLPDAIEGFFLVLSIYLAVVAVRRAEGGRAHAIGAGAALGLAYFTRVNALVFLPGILAVGWFVGAKSPGRRLLWTLVGLLGVLVAGAGIFWALSGDPLVDWHRSASFYAGYASDGFIQRAHPFWWSLLHEEAYKVWFFPALLLGTLASLLKRRGPRWLLLVWVYGFWFYLDVLSPLHGLDSAYRYAEPLAVPVAVLVAVAVFDVGEVLRPLVRRMFVAGVAVVLAVVLVPVSASLTRRYAHSPRWVPVKAVAEKVANSSDPVWVDDPWVLLGVNYYSGFTLGRDTLEAADAPVNSRARLFATSEVPLPTKGPARAVLLSPPPDTGWETAAQARYVRQTLTLYELKRSSP